MRQLSIHSNACARQCRCTRLVPAQGIRCLQKAMPAQGTYTCMNPTAIHKEPHTRMHQVWLYCKRTCVIPSVVAMGGILYCIVLYCIVLCCIVLYCIVWYCIVLSCIVLHCDVVDFTKSGSGDTCCGQIKKGNILPCKSIHTTTL